MLRRLRELLLHPGGAWARLLDRFVYPALLARRRGLTLQGRVVLRGMPRVQIGDGAAIVLGDNVTLNSKDRGYHLNLYAPTKLMADRPGARILVGDNTRMSGTCIHAYRSVTVGRNCLIAGNTQIFDGSGHDLCFPHVEERLHTAGSAEEIVIEDNVWIGAHSIVLPGVRIGYGAVIGAGSVVTRDVPRFALAAGNPARVVRDFSSSRTDTSTA